MLWPGTGYFNTPGVAETFNSLTGQGRWKATHPVLTDSVDQPRGAFDNRRRQVLCRLRSKTDFKEAVVKKSIVTFVLLFALPGLAQKPTIQMMPWPTAGVLGPTASACGFDILATPQAGRPNKEKLILLGDAGIITGPLFLTLKNLTTGKTVDINISGPAQLAFSMDTTTLVIHGPGLGAFPPPPRICCERPVCRSFRFLMVAL
jgi:hypothetical protein